MFKLQKDYPDYEYKSLRLPTELIKQVQTLADANNLSFNKVVIQCIEYALDNMESKLKFYSLSLLILKAGQVKG